MARKVFFSFDYDDVIRANVVRNSDVITKQYQNGARFHDRSLWEKTQTQGNTAIMRMIDGALEGSSVTCVLIGQHTWQSEWVRYEILKSMSRGNGILGVQIHDVGFDPAGVPTTLSGLTQRLLAPQPGRNPFPLLGYTIGSAQVTAMSSAYLVAFHEIGPDGQWRHSKHVKPMPHRNLNYLSVLKNAGNLANLFRVYDWKSQNGSQNFPGWVEEAARKVGR